MTHQTACDDFRDHVEYHGNTAVEVTRKKGDMTIWHEWIYFDSVDEAQCFFHEYPLTGGGHA